MPLARDNQEREGQPLHSYWLGKIGDAQLGPIYLGWLGAEGLDPATDLAGVIGLAGPYDFLPLRDETLKTIFGPEPLAQTQPIAHAGGEAPPMLLLFGAGAATLIGRRRFARKQAAN